MAKKKAAARKKKRARKVVARKTARRLRKPVARIKSRAPKPVAPVRAAARELAMVEAVGAADDRLTALQEKRAALQKLDAHLAVQVPSGPAETIAIRQARENIVDATRAVDAKIVAARTQVLAPPSAVDIAALRTAIGDAETVIAQNAVVNRLVSATTALINAFNA